jgi:hypothetical protein
MPRKALLKKYATRILKNYGKDQDRTILTNPGYTFNLAKMAGLRQDIPRTASFSMRVCLVVATGCLRQPILGSSRTTCPYRTSEQCAPGLWTLGKQFDGMSDKTLGARVYLRPRESFK